MSEPTAPAAPNTVPLTPENAFEQAGARVRLAYEGSVVILRDIQGSIRCARNVGDLAGARAGMPFLENAQKINVLLREAVLLLQHARPAEPSVATAQSN